MDWILYDRDLRYDRVNPVEAHVTFLFTYENTRKPEVFKGYIKETSLHKK